MEKKTYEKPEVIVIIVDEKDIVTASQLVNWMDIPEGDESEV